MIAPVHMIVIILPCHMLAHVDGNYEGPLTTVSGINWGSTRSIDFFVILVYFTVLIKGGPIKF